MGLAASQARFLGITARKSNIEYEGQQVNQQRTALAEEVNALFGRLVALKVPIAPSAEEFYETNYTFEVSQAGSGYIGDYKISTYYLRDDGFYHVEGTRTYHTTGATGSWTDHSTIRTKEGKYYYKPAGSQDETELTLVTDPTDLANYRNYLKEVGAYTYYDKDAEGGGKNVTLSDEQIAQDNLYCYQDSNGNVAYFSEFQITNGENILPGKGLSLDMYLYTIGDTLATENFEWNDVSLTMDTNGRISNISKSGCFGSTNVNAKKEYNTEAYDAALRDYTMSKDEYNKAVEDINAKTKSLQQEDKVLELRLNQIDTEQNELSTELEAVKAVLDKNIENTFKTFA